MNILKYNDFIELNEAFGLASIKAKERVQSGIIANKQNLADLANKIKGKASAERGGKLRDLNDKINDLLVKKREEKDPERKREIQRQIKKYVMKKRRLQKIDHFWG